MKDQQNHKERLASAKKQVRRIQIFYIHLAGYIVVAALILLNFYVMDEGPHTKAVVWINTSTLVGWTIFIGIHWYRVFRGRFLFKKSWEDRKIKEYLKEDSGEETTMWE
jgi:2TM domain